MKKRINAQFIVVVFIAIVTTLVFTTGVFYKLFQKEVLEELKTYSYVLQDIGEYKEIEEADTKIARINVRITWIDENGAVLYDNVTDASSMDNHALRPEIVSAFEKGEGSSIRKSSTVEKSIFYYAVKLGDGTVLRIGKEVRSIWNIFETAFLKIVGIAIALFIVCLILTHHLTKILMAPIEQMANHLDEIGSIHAYKELQPFIETIQKQHENIVKNAKMRQEFTANVSHELKTPLTSISGYSELIENGMASDQEAVVRFAREIHRNANRLLTLINDIIKLSEMDGSDLVVEFEKTDLYEIAQDCVHMLQMNAEKHGITMKMEGCHSEIIANKQMMEEVVYNLCDNAIRYNNDGGNIWVSVVQNEEKTILEVKDDGIGISKKDQERIFERFYRVDKSRSKSTGGTGLGLAIVKHIVAQHGAKLDIESELGKGTLIRIEFSV